MPVDLKILEKVGSSNARLKEFFTASWGGGGDEKEVAESPEKRGQRWKDYNKKQKFLDRLSARLSEGMDWGLKNYSFYSAVDLAWEPPPLAKELFPLMLYAQERIDINACIKQLTTLGCADDFVKKDAKGKIVGINYPKFHEISTNLVRSFISRRLAAQSNKYNNLWPYFRYESRSTGQVGKLRADLFSQRSDIAADQFGWRHHDTQAYRDAMLYGWTMDFVRSSWEREVHWAGKPKMEGDGSEITFENKVHKEGLAWVNPHPSRVFWDNSSPLASINDDIGCEWVGFWDVTRFKNIGDNPTYWNRATVGYTQNYVNIFSTYGQYFSQYYCNINVPKPNRPDLTGSNDRLNQVGYYSTEKGDESIVVAQYFEKIVPRDWGIGRYPYPVWVRMVVAGNDTVIYAEFLPSTPGAYLGMNQKDDRALSLGFGHELLSYQDQMSNLQSALLLALQADNQKVLVLDIDVLSPEQRKGMRDKATGKGDRNAPTHVLEVSRKKLQELGLTLEDIVELIETKSSTQINLIFQAMLQLLSMVERLMALSPQEQGQPAPREISATEVNVITGTTESVYNFISDSIDEFRAAKKRIFYESYMQFGDANFVLPVAHRYTNAIIQAAGLQIAPNTEVDPGPSNPERPRQHTLIGTKTQLNHDYIFTSRDGAERSSNPQSAASMSEVLKTILPIPAVQENMTVGQLFDIVNELARASGSFDLKLEADDPDKPLAPSAAEEVQEVLEKVTSNLESQQDQINQLAQSIQPQPVTRTANAPAPIPLPA